MALCSLAYGANRTVTENDSLGNKKRVIELKDTVVDGKTVTDTLSVMTYESSSSKNGESEDNYKHHSGSYNFGWNLGHDTKRSLHRRNSDCIRIRLPDNRYFYHILLPIQKPESQISLGGAGTG